MSALSDIIGRPLASPFTTAKSTEEANTNSQADPNVSDLRPIGSVSPTEEHLDATSQAAKIANDMQRWFHNPWQMIKDGVIYSNDEADLLCPIKQFPDESWLETVAYEWLNNRLTLLPKSRRMKCSWMMIFLHTHLAMFNEGLKIFFVSDKEEKSDELVERAHFIMKYIPEDRMLKPQFKKTYCSLHFPGLNTEIIGVPMGADQLRQYTASAILADEFAFWEKGRETYMASIPTIQGGGRFTAISSPQVGFFKDLCFDQVR